LSVVPTTDTSLSVNPTSATSLAAR
jgi:hypothetical protein